MRFLAVVLVAVIALSSSSSARADNSTPASSQSQQQPCVGLPVKMHDDGLTDYHWWGRLNEGDRAVATSLEGKQRAITCRNAQFKSNFDDRDAAIPDVTYSKLTQFPAAGGAAMDFPSFVKQFRLIFPNSHLPNQKTLLLTFITQQSDILSQQVEYFGKQTETSNSNGMASVKAASIGMNNLMSFVTDMSTEQAALLNTDPGGIGAAIDLRLNQYQNSEDPFILRLVSQLQNYRENFPFRGVKLTQTLTASEDLTAARFFLQIKSRDYEAAKRANSANPLLFKAIHQAGFELSKKLKNIQSLTFKQILAAYNAPIPTTPAASEAEIASSLDSDESNTNDEESNSSPFPSVANFFRRSRREQSPAATKVSVHVNVEN